MSGIGEKKKADYRANKGGRRFFLMKRLPSEKGICFIRFCQETQGEGRKEMLINCKKKKKNELLSIAIERVSTTKGGEIEQNQGCTTL